MGGVPITKTQHSSDLESLLLHFLDSEMTGCVTVKMGVLLETGRHSLKRYAASNVRKSERFPLCSNKSDKQNHSREIQVLLSRTQNGPVTLRNRLVGGGGGSKRVRERKAANPFFFHVENLIYVIGLHLPGLHLSLSLVVNVCKFNKVQ